MLSDRSITRMAFKDGVVPSLTLAVSVCVTGVSSSMVTVNLPVAASPLESFTW